MCSCSLALDQHDAPCEELDGHTVLQPLDHKCVVARQVVMESRRNDDRNDRLRTELGRRAWAYSAYDIAKRVVPPRVHGQVARQAFPPNDRGEILVARER